MSAMDSIWQDLKYSARGLRRSPGFTVAAGAALALGIGANTVIFSVVNSVLLNPVAFEHMREPGRLVMIWEKNPSLSVFFANRMPPRPSSLREWKKQNQSFEDMALWIDGTTTLTSENDRAGLKPEQVSSGTATANFFPLLGIRLRLGRNFNQEETTSGKSRVTIISDELFTSRFNRDPQALGRTLIADGKTYRIIGVLAPNFRMPATWGGFDQKKPKLWMPLESRPGDKSEDSFNSYVFARLKPGVTLEKARAEMNVIGNRLLAAFPERNAGFGINVATLDEENVGDDLRRALVVLYVAVVFVLLIACANVGNLLLTRAVAREKEIAVRTALGAGRLRILKQTVTESLLLSFMAAATGLVLSYWALRAINAFAPEDMHSMHDLRMDSGVLWFTTAIAVAAALLFGIAPALHSLKGDVNEVLSRTSRSVVGSSQRVRTMLATAEIALSLVLLIGAGLMIRTLGSLMSTDLGFRPDHLLIMRISLPESKYGKPEQQHAFSQQLIDGVRRVPGVQNAALTNAMPMKSVNQSSFEIPGRTYKPGSIPTSDWAYTSDAYFETLGIKVRKGRTYTRQEALAEHADVCVVNDAFVRTHFPNEEALGKTIKFNDRAWRIIGVVANEHQMGPDNEQHPEFYLPSSHLQSPLLVTRTAGDPLSMASAVKQQVWNIDKEQPIAEVGTEEEALRSWVAPRRFNMIILLTFAGIALALAAVGLYSVIAYSVSLRTREIGIRMALGADSRAVTVFFVRQGLGMTLAGVVAGLVGAFVLTRFMQSLIFGVSAVDPLTFAGVSAVLIVISVAASYVPALRAARILPVEALRAE